MQQKSKRKKGGRRTWREGWVWKMQEGSRGRDLLGEKRIGNRAVGGGVHNINLT